MRRQSLVVAEARIERAILLVGGRKVMLDADLARLYGVSTGVLVQAVRRNAARFPADFMFRLTPDEVANLRSQIVISSLGRGWGGRRFMPYAFTELGVAMLSSVLRSPRAILVNIAIMRTFVRLRQILASHDVLTEKLNALEKKYDAQFRSVFDAIRQLMAPAISGHRAVGFRPRADTQTRDRQVGHGAATPGTPRRRVRARR